MSQPEANTQGSDPPLSRTRQQHTGEFRCLQVNVPKRLFDLAKAKALMIGLPWPDFVVQLLTEATSDLATGMPTETTRE